MLVFTIGLFYLVNESIEMISGFHDGFTKLELPNSFNDRYEQYDFENEEHSHDENDSHFEPEFVFKAFGYKFYDKNFNISLGEEVLTDSRFLKVDIKKVE